MMNRLLIALCAAASFTLGGAIAQTTRAAPSNIPDGFAPIAFMAGSCWEGPLPDFVAASTGVGPRSVTHCVRWRLENQVLTDTLYMDGLTPPVRGETNYYWDAESKILRYIFWSVAGSYSVGTMRTDGPTMIFDDERLVGGSRGTVQFTTTWTPSGPDAFVQNRQRRNADGTWTNAATGVFKRKPLR
jgi:hypothetical protein